MVNYSTTPGYSLYQEGAVTIRTDEQHDDYGKPTKTVMVWAGDKQYANFDGDEDNLSKTIVRGASIRGGILTVSTTNVSMEGDATRHFDHRHNVDTGALISTTETTEYEGGEPGSTILSYRTTDPEGELLKAGREVIWNE